MRVLVTGGTGYIGGHTCVELLLAGHSVLVLDNLSNSSAVTIDAIGRAAGRTTDGAPVPFVQGDVRDGALLEVLLRQHRIDAVLHLAALKSAAESCRDPLGYFDNNVGGTLSLLLAMQRAGVKHFVFSSSAAVYGEVGACPVPECAPANPVHPYGRSKWMCEQILRDCVHSDPGLRSAVLRYFNPAGAHSSGLLGDAPVGDARSLFWSLCEVATGNSHALQVFGNDYPTTDGTGVRDYLHVADVARAHVAALELIADRAANVTLNLGRGRGWSVLDVVRAFEKVSGRSIPLEFQPRRPGDVASSVADPARAHALLQWRARCGIEQICMDAWRWHSIGRSGRARRDG